MQAFIREYNLPFLFIAMVLGYELSIYFFLLYKKVKNNKLTLNKILLGYGFFFLSIVTSLLFSTLNTYYFSDSNYSNFLNILTILSLTVGIVLFLSILTSQEFITATNKLIIWILILFDLIPSILIFFYDINSISVQISTLSTSISIIYIFYVQYLLIKRSAGSIEKRLKLILLGEILVSFGLLLNREGAWFYPFLDNSILKIISLPPLLAGFGLLLISIYRFPAFYEFNWKDDLVKLYIIDRDSAKTIFSYDFKQQEQDQEDLIPQYDLESLKASERVLIGGLIGIDEIISEVTDSKTKKLDKIKQGDYVILLNYQEISSINFVFCLMAQNDTFSINHFLKSLTDQFFVFYKELIQEIKKLDLNPEQLFSSFNLIIKNQLA